MKGAVMTGKRDKKGRVLRQGERQREDGRYDLRCVVSENGNKILDLGLIIESKYQLDKMVYNFNERPEVVYRGIISLLTGDINYLID